MSAAIKQLTASDRLSNLYSELEQNYKFRFIQNINGNFWGCEVADDVASITFCDTDAPEPCLAHELLHAWLQSKGYRRLRIGYSSFDQSPWFGNLITALDNELQHHRMYSKFLELGFRPKEFFGEADKGIFRYLSAVIKKHKGSIKDVLLGFLSLIAPGGTLTAAQTDQLMKGFYGLNDGAYEETFNEICAAFSDWNKSIDLDVSVPAKRIMLALEKSTHTWFGYSIENNFPDDGFFVDTRFELD